MNYPRFLALAVLLLPSIAEGATVIKPIVACKAEADSKKVVDFMAKNDISGLDAFSSPRLSSRDCLSLLKGMTVDVDKKDGRLFCVRPTGGLDCYWTVDVAINQKPAAESDTDEYSPFHFRKSGETGSPSSDR
jgi:hypothetical protein